MASTHKHIRSSTANKRPTTAIADGQIALNTNSTSPGLFFKDSTGATIIKVGPVHVGTTAPNVSPAAGGSSGNSTGEIWLDTSLTPNGVKIWNGASWTNATPIGSTTVQGLLELATNAETQTGTDPDRAVTPAGLQSKVSDSTSTTSSTTIASSTAVKAAYDLANAAIPASGGTVTGNLEIGTTGSFTFEGSTANGFETTLAVVDPTADQTITLPNVTGTVITTGDTGTVTSTMIADGAIVDADVNASAAIAHSKLANITAGQVLLGNASNVPTATALSGDVTVNSSGVTAISSGVVVDADISATAEIAVSKLADGTARQLLQTDAAGTGVEWTSNVDIPGTLDVTGAAVFDSTANIAGNLTVDTNTFFVDATNNRVGVGTNSPNEKLQVAGNLYVSGGDIYIDTAKMISTSNTNPLRFGVGLSEKAQIDGSGRFLVGTSSASSTCLAEFRSLPGLTGGTTVAFSRGDGGTAAGQELGTLLFTNSSGNQAASIRALTGTGWGGAGTANYPGTLSFSTTPNGSSAPTERMAISSTGATVITHANNTYNLYLNNSRATGYTDVIFRADFSGYAPNNATARYFSFGDTAAIRAELRSNGGLANYQANNVNLSDINTKKDISPAAGTWDCVKEWEIVSYRYKDQPNDADLNLGVIAQQVAVSCPEIVTIFEEAKDDQPEKLGVKEQQMYWMAIKALQEAQMRIEALEAKVAALESA